MKKILVFCLVTAVLAALLCTTVFGAAKEYFYVNSETGNDEASGTSVSTAVKTFTQACRCAEKSGADKAYIVVTNEYAMPANVTEITHKVPFVVTTKDSSTDYGAKLVFGKNLRYILSGDTTFEDITIEYTGTLNCVARYNHITFGEGVVTRRLDSEKSGLYVVGGWQSPSNDNDATLDSHITINSGSFLYVIGGSRQRAEGASGLTLTGTHYITVEGGNIENLLGASAQHNWSRNASITMSGGYVKNFYTGGDASRRLDGTAELTLTGGEIGTLYVNNVVGNATVKLLGTKVGSVSVSYYNAEIEELETKAKSVKTLIYDGLYYTDAEIAEISGFDKVENESKIYVSNDGTGSGTSEKDPTNFETAFKKAGQSGSTIVIVGRVYVTNFGGRFGTGENPVFDKKITVTGDTLVIKGNFYAPGEIEFTNIKMMFQTFEFSRVPGTSFEGFKDEPAISTVNCTFAADVKMSESGEKVDVHSKYFEAKAGTFGTVSAQNIVIDGATVSVADVKPYYSVNPQDGQLEISIGSSSVELLSGRIGTVKTDEAKEKTDIIISGGTLKMLSLFDTVPEYSFVFLGGKIEKCQFNSKDINGNVTFSEAFDTANVKELLALCDKSSQNVFFIKDGALGNGASANAPSPSLDAAYAALGESGGTIVVCDEFTISKAFNTGKNNGKITFTSVYGGVDYQKTNGAAMVFAQNFYCGGDTEFNNITIKSGGNYKSIFANCHEVVFGENITSYADEATNTYMSVMGAASSAAVDMVTNLTINSGTWQRVRGGSSTNQNKNLTVNLTVNGGRFIEQLTLGSNYSHEGTITATINGGVFQRGIYASTLTKDEHYFHSDITLTINGGTFYGNIAPAKLSKGLYRGAYGGSFNVTVNGGYFAHLVEMQGTNAIGSMTSTISISDAIDINAEMTGTYSFTNPIRTNGADPWLFYCDGYYYYTATGGSTVGFAKAANIGDLKYAEYVTIYDPEDGHEWSKNLWSPEIHYYTDEEIGEGNGGWYLFMACDDGDNVHHRMYVAKCLDGDNLLGRWGNPVTGEVNVPQRVEAKEIPDFDNTWAAGMSEIRINGKLYMLYITEAGRGTADMHQTINIVEMTNPWTIVGQSKVICYSEYDWEKGGYALNTKTGEYWPMVVEGSTAVYGEDGSVYIIYSGSGYWTTMYNLAELKYIGGDPLEITSWQKKSEPILYKSDSINGCGHASYVTDTSGQGWVCYHAYIGKDTTSGRFAFVEPYFADKNGVVIADGSGHPAPIETVYTVDVNPRPLAKRIVGFDSVNALGSAFAKTREYDGRFSDVTDSHWFAPYVKNAYELSLANGISQTKFSPDNTFTVAQALTAAANIHTAYYSKSVRTANAGEAWYVPYVEYCVQNGIINEGQFADVNANITRGDMAIVFANILPDSEYTATKSGSNSDVTSDMACYSAVMKLYQSGIVGGDAATGNYRPNDSIKRSEACVIFTRIAMKGARA